MNQENLTLETTQPETIVVETMPTLRRRVSATGEKHGRAVSQVGVVTVAYSTGFAKGFMAGFSER